MESGTRIIMLLVPITFRSSCERSQRWFTNFGKSALGGFRQQKGRVSEKNPPRLMLICRTRRAGSWNGPMINLFDALKNPGPDGAGRTEWPLLSSPAPVPMA